MLIGICLLFFTGSSFAEAPKYGSLSLNKPMITTARTIVNIGNWAYWMYDDGQSGLGPDDNSGGFYPRGTAACIFEDGLVWGAFLLDPGTMQLIPTQSMRVGGSTYRQGNQPGPILSQGVADDPGNNRIYRIRLDWPTLSFGQVAQGAAEFFQIDLASVTQSQADEIIAQYRTDWNEWPTDLGAPFVDINGNGIYEPVIDGAGDVSFEGDYPGIALADQVIFTVTNDLDPSKTTDLYGSQPIGLETQITAWAYNQPNAGLGQLIFKKYKLINKSAYYLDSMYVAQWCDPDVGNAGNDLVGCDTVLSIGYSYNGPAQDVDYLDFNLSPSAIGYDFFQGPIVPTGNEADTAIFNLEKISGYVNLPMTAFGYFAAGSPFGEDPELGEYKGSKEWYNLLRGFGTISDDIVNPTPFLVGSGINVGQITKFPMSGDPVGDPNGVIGDVDGKGQNPVAADRRMSLSSGPFDLPQWEDVNGNGIPDFPDPGVQEVVLAIVGGNSGPSSSGNNLLSVDVMKNTDIVAQKLFDDLFQSVPKAPSDPDVKVVLYEKEITLEWGSNLAAVAKTEADNPLTGYNFQGYNIYQMPTSAASKDESTLLATYDVIDGVQTIFANRFDPIKGQVVPVAVQLGKDAGVQRQFTITADAIRGLELYPGNTYYFAVTAYNYNEAPTLIEDKTLESGLIAIPVMPQSTKPGVRYSANTGDDVEDIEHTSSASLSDGQVFVEVIDPEALTGETYEVFFKEFQYIELDEGTIVTIDSVDTLINVATGDTTFVVVDSTVTTVVDTMILTAVGWNLRNASTGDTILTNQLQAASNTELGRNRQIVDGMEFVVTGPPLEFKVFEVVQNADGPIDPSEMGCFAFNDNGFPFLFNDLYTDGTDRPDGSRQQANGSTWGFNVGGGANDGTWETFLARSLRNDNADRAIPYDFEMRFNAEVNYGNWAFTSGNTATVPFELWNIGIATPDDPSDDYRMIPWVLDEVVENDVYDFGTNSDGTGLDHGVSGGANDPYMDWVYFRAPQDLSPGTAGYDQFVVDGLAGTYDFNSPEVWARTVLVNWNGGTVTDPTFPANVDALVPEEGSIFRAITNKPNTEADKFTVLAPAAPSSSNAAAISDVSQISVYPNPYYGTNSEQLGRFDKFVTFNHLPANQTVTIRIFALNGQQVRKLEKHTDASADGNQFYRWDLDNESGLPVASGIYIAYIDMPDLGETKVLKVFIVQSAEILRFF
jgi:hypothetical protein